MTTSSDRIEAQPAFVLHSFPYKDTSSLVDYFSRDFGRVRMLVKGVRRKNSRLRDAIQPFQPLAISWQGKGELKTLIAAETTSLYPFLQGRTLWCALYLNELVVRLLPQWDSVPRLFAYYQFAISSLNDIDTQESILRIFERRLIEELGFAVSFTESSDKGKAIVANKDYCFHPQRGFNLASNNSQKVSYSGDVILSIAEDNYADKRVRLAAKQLMRISLSPHLGTKPLQSRELFKGHRQVNVENMPFSRNTEGE